MIFSETLPQVLDGTKTQTRRPRKESDKIVMIGICESPNTVYASRVIRGGRLLWEVGRTYAVQPGRSKHSVGRIKITRIRSTLLQMINKEDAIAEGFEDTYGFYETWMKLYPRDRARYSTPIYALDFELVKGSNDGHQT